MAQIDVVHQERSIETNGVCLHTVFAGPEDGPLLILLHGFPELWYGWRKQIAPLSRAGYRVAVPDQRGYNLSDKPRSVRSYMLDQLAADVVGLIDAAGCERAFIVGHDWGAAVAWWCAIRHPERVAKAAVLNVPHPLVMQRHVRRSFSQMRKSWYVAFFQIPWLPEALIRATASGPMFEVLRRTARPGAFTNADAEVYRSAWSQPGAARAMLGWYRAAVRYAAKSPVARDTGSFQVRIPVLIIWGVRDRFLDFEMAEQSLALCDRARLEATAEAPHWVQHEQPERVNRRQMAFFTAADERPRQGFGSE